MPRREYSDAAIASRKRIIDRAYETLTDRDQFVDGSNGAGTDGDRPVLTMPPQIEADEKDFAGLLLVLYELGESDKVLSLAKPYYDPDEAEYQSARISPQDPDLLLSVSLAYLDLGREYWKEGHYESAAGALESAQEILLREGLFLSIRSEIQADLLRLRPYRILELLATPDNHTAEHRRGLSLLQEMLDARRGIDGSGNDSSSLGIDDFLRFIQQLRSYMTVIEQQTLFEEEARRPSSVATYLAVYALVARGFSQRQPALIRRAKGLLVKLSAKQDIYLEKAVCALLLGQTEEASAAIGNSSEGDQINFIRQNSEGAPDLLPGLCLYSERWMQEEVYPHFRDLMNQVVSLKDYFADEQVQSYLEELPNTGAVSSEWTTPVGNVFATRSPVNEPLPIGRDLIENSVDLDPKLSAYIPAETNRFQRSVTSIVDNSANAATNVNGSYTSGLPRSPRSRDVAPTRKSNRNSGESFREIKRPVSSNAQAPKRKFNLGRLVTVIVIAIAILVGSINLVVWAFRSLAGGGSRPEVIALEKPIANLMQVVEKSNTVLTAQPGPLDKQTANKIIATWQVNKSKALGKEYEDKSLSEILADPALSDWQSRAKELKSTNSYLQYQTKSSEVDTVTNDGDSKARVVAKIFESRNYFYNGELDRDASKADTSYTVEYDLIKKDNKWLIREMLVF
jgi:hypothetical protein